MKQGAFFSLALTAILGAIAVPMLPSFAQAQSTTRINDLQQRARGTTISGEVVNRARLGKINYAATTDATAIRH